MPDIGSLGIAVTADTRQAEAALSGLLGKANAFGTGVGGAMGKGLQAAEKLSLALVGVGAAAATGAAVAVKSAANLEQSVANIASIKPEIDTSAVFNSLNQMQTRVAQSSDALGASLYNVFSSIETSQEGALALVEKFGRGAVAAQTDAETFGTSILGVMNAYKLGVGDADRVSDIFFNTVKLGVVTGGELAQNMGLVTQSAKMAGMSVEDLGGFIAGVTKEGGPAAQNINNLNNLLLKLNTKEAAKGFEELGISTTTASGEMRPVIDVMTDLRTKTEGMTEAGKLAAIQKIFPDLQARAGATVIMSQLDFVKAAIKENTEVAGSASAAYETMAATMNSQLTILGNTVSSVVNQVGVRLLPAVTPVVKMISQGLPAAFATFDATVTPVLGRFAESAQSAFEQFAKGFAELVGIETADITSPFDQLAGAVQVVAADVIAAGSVMIGWFQNDLVPALRSVGDWLGPRLVATAQVGLQLWPALVTAGQAFVEFLRARTLPALGQFADWLGPKLVAAAGLAVGAFPALLDAVGAFTDWISDTAIPAILGFADWLGPKLQAAAGVALSIWPAVIAAGQTFTTWITSTAIPALTLFGEWLQPRLQATWTWLTTTAFPAIITAGQAAVTWITGPLVAGFTTLAEWLQPKLTAAWTWLTTTAFPAIVTAGNTVLTWISGPLAAGFTELGGWLQPKLEPAWAWLTQTAWPAIGTAISEVTAWMQGTVFPVFAELFAWLSPNLAPAVTWLTDTAWPAIRTAIGDVASWIQSDVFPVFGDLAEWLRPKIEPAVAWLTDFAWPGLKLAAMDVRDAIAAWVEQMGYLWTELEKKQVFVDLADAWTNVQEAGNEIAKALGLVNPEMGTANQTLGEGGLTANTLAWAQGIKDVSSAIRELTGLLAPAVKLVVDFGKAMWALKQFTSTPSERPMIDLPQILKGLGLNTEGMGLGSGAGGDILNFSGTPTVQDAIRDQQRRSQTVGPGPSAPGSRDYGNPWANKAAAAAIVAGIDPDQFVAQMAQESINFNEDVIAGRRNSPAGAQGIAQFMPGTAAGLGVNPLDPDAALAAAAQLMAKYQAQYGDKNLALAAYNAGPGAVARFGGVPPYRETQTYIAEVERRRGSYAELPRGQAIGTEQFAGVAVAAEQVASKYVLPIAGMLASEIQKHWNAEEGIGATDLFAPAGTPVQSIGAGRVTSAGYNALGGNAVMIEGDDGNMYYYAHLQDIPQVKSGDRVEPGTILGAVGNTGNAINTPSHLHLGIGKTIGSGTGPLGGAGTDFNAVEFLKGIAEGGNLVPGPVRSAVADADGALGPQGAGGIAAAAAPALAQWTRATESTSEATRKLTDDQGMLGERVKESVFDVGELSRQQGNFATLMAGQVTPAMAGTTGGLQTMQEAIGPVLRDVAATNMTMPELQTNLVTMAANAGLGVEPLQRLQAGTVGEFQALEMLGRSLATTNPQFAELWTQFDQGAIDSDELTLRFLQLIASFGEAPKAAEAVTTAAEAISTASGGAAEVFTQGTETMTDAQLAMQEKLLESGGEIGEEYPALMEQTRERAAAAFAALTEEATGSVEELTANVTGEAETTREETVSSFEGMNTDVESTLGKLVDIGTTGFEALGEGIEGVLDPMFAGIVADTEQFVDDIEEEFRNLDDLDFNPGSRNSSGGDDDDDDDRDSDRGGNDDDDDDRERSDGGGGGNGGGGGDDDEDENRRREEEERDRNNNAQHGLIVPGFGSGKVPIWAHPREIVLNEREQEVVRGLLGDHAEPAMEPVSMSSGGMGGGGTTVIQHFHVAGSIFGEEDFLHRTRNRFVQTGIRNGQIWPTT